MKKISEFMLIFVLVLASSIIINGQVPHLINYQGKLMDEGSPLNGSAKITFTINDELTSGNILWSEEHQNIVVENGIFNVILGSKENIDASLFKDNINCFLGITVNDQELSPRSQITSTAYSIQSENSISARFSMSEFL